MRQNTVLDDKTKEALVRAAMERVMASQETMGRICFKNVGFLLLPSSNVGLVPLGPMKKSPDLGNVIGWNG